MESPSGSIKKLEPISRRYDHCQSCLSYVFLEIRAFPLVSGTWRARSTHYKSKLRARNCRQSNETKCRADLTGHTTLRKRGRAITNFFQSCVGRLAQKWLLITNKVSIPFNVLLASRTFTVIVTLPFSTHTTHIRHAIFSRHSIAPRCGRGVHVQLRLELLLVASARCSRRGGKLILWVSHNRGSHARISTPPITRSTPSFDTRSLQYAECSESLCSHRFETSSARSCRFLIRQRSRRNCIIPRQGELLSVTSESEMIC